VVFDGLDSGQYFGQFSKAGYVDPNGTNVVRPANGWNVTTGSTSISTYQYDLAGAIVFAFDTKYGTNTWSVTNPDAVTLMHQNIPGPPQQGARIQTVPNGTSTYTFGALFPFLTPYTSFAGDCSATAPPATFPNQVHTVGPGATVGSVAAPKTLRMPTLAYKVTRTNSSGVTSNRQNARVKVRPATGTCITPRAFASLTPAKLTDANGDLKPLGSSDANVFALPYGSFIACADDNNGASTKKNESPPILNDDPNGNKTVTINIDTRVGASNGTSTGSC
jgi:hypothetical protein